jgi:UDP-N-acetylmuramate dehydrogenase
MENIESKFRENVNLKDFSTFRIGGIAEFFLEIQSKEDLVEAFSFAQNNDKKIHILGGGSNALISDGLIMGLVIIFKNNNLKL